MKNTFLLLLLSVFIVSCNDKKAEADKEEVQQETTVAANQAEGTYEGEFIYTADASVLKGNSFVYGVEMNEMAKDLGKKVEAVKQKDYDMVPVIVRGVVTHKPENTEGWDEIITITEIINVSDTPTAADVELKANKS